MSLSITHTHIYDRSLKPWWGPARGSALPSNCSSQSSTQWRPKGPSRKLLELLNTIYTIGLPHCPHGTYGQVVQDTLALVSAYVPIGHMPQLDEIFVEVFVPGGHGEHVPALSELA